MNYKNLIKEIVINNIPSLKSLSVSNFKTVEDYNNYINWESGRYYNFTGERTLRSINLEVIIKGLKELNIGFKEYTIFIGSYRTVKEIEIIGE